MLGTEVGAGDTSVNLSYVNGVLGLGCSFTNYIKKANITVPSSRENAIPVSDK